MKSRMKTKVENRAEQEPVYDVEIFYNPREEGVIGCIQRAYRMFKLEVPSEEKLRKVAIPCAGLPKDSLEFAVATFQGLSPSNSIRLADYILATLYGKHVKALIQNYPRYSAEHELVT
ncbi:hypothetical protein J4463_04495 [Candidatus Pacearchaeota archaeon]|nr:hypothetical protein [Candidatus Pacearchaeota archaeon]